MDLAPCLDITPFTFLEPFPKPRSIVAAVSGIESLIPTPSTSCTAEDWVPAQTPYEAIYLLERPAVAFVPPPGRVGAGSVSQKMMITAQLTMESVSGYFQASHRGARKA
jgi:hypothetical protein